MADEEWTVTRAMNHFDELFEYVIACGKPVFIKGKRRTAVLVSMEEWKSIQDKLSRAPSDL